MNEELERALVGGEGFERTVKGLDLMLAGDTRVVELDCSYCQFNISSL